MEDTLKQRARKAKLAYYRRHPEQNFPEVFYKVVRHIGERYLTAESDNEEIIQQIDMACQKYKPTSHAQMYKLLLKLIQITKDERLIRLRAEWRDNEKKITEYFVRAIEISRIKRG